MSSTDFELDDNFGEDDVNFDEASSKLSAKESLEKRRLIDDRWCFKKYAEKKQVGF
ncbi:hypothetical protein F995_01083 [Acinetobacter sp. CIP A162]|nr:hypothetical protein F995_01083 [Acinetobacter sp. CIP A162]